MKLIFETVAGSHLYGTALPTSDMDKRGVCYDPYDALIGLKKFDVQTVEGEDTQYFGLTKFFILCLQCNPNIVELLFAPAKSITYYTSVWDTIIKHSNDFLNEKGVRNAFMGYAVSQLKRIETHHRWMTVSPPQTPIPEDFGGYLKSDGSGYKWPDNDNQNRYQAAHKQYKQYKNWLENRNPQRHELEEKFGYDCYTDETEFLTNRGWLKYDDIVDSDLLGTVNPRTLVIEFQNFIDRIKKPYNGIIYSLETINTKCEVTPNHRMMVCDVHRKKSNSFTTKPDDKFYFEKLDNLIANKKSYYGFCSLPINDNKDYQIDDWKLKLIGCYVSEGSVSFRDGKIKSLTFSQTNNGKKEFYEVMNDISEHLNVRRYDYSRTGDLIETTWIIHDEIKNWIVENCGYLSNNKKLPDFYNKLSERQSKLLLDVLVLGDGTVDENGRIIYYTNSYVLSGQMQFLSVLSGYNCRVCDYIEKHKIYQVIISNFIRKTNVVVINDKLNHKISKTNIVCFTVPNETLITRNNGKMSYQGNTKHAMHLIRLYQEGIELLTKGRITLPRPNAGVLLSIRNGNYTYDELMEWVEELDKNINSVKSVLPEKSNYETINDLLMRINYQYIKGLYYAK